MLSYWANFISGICWCEIFLSLFLYPQFSYDINIPWTIDLIKLFTFSKVKRLRKAYLKAAAMVPIQDSETPFIPAAIQCFFKSYSKCFTKLFPCIVISLVHTTAFCLGKKSSCMLFNWNTWKTLANACKHTWMHLHINSDNRVWGKSPP